MLFCDRASRRRIFGRGDGLVDAMHLGAKRSARFRYASVRLRIDFDGLLVLVDRVLFISQAQKGVAEVVVRDRVVRA